MKSAVQFFLLVWLVVSGCNTNDQSGVQYRTLSDKATVFKVTVDATVLLDDTFGLYYTTDGSIDFSKINPVWVKVKGNQKPQQISFSLPKGVVPTELRIDLGQNLKQSEIYLKKIWLSYNGKAVEFPGTMIFSYFRPDLKKTKINATTGMVRGIVKNGIRQSPSLYPKDADGPLREEIERLTR